MAAKKHDPFFVHLWDELTNANILQAEGLARWMDVPAKLQAQFIAAAQKAMHAALGAPPRARPKPKTAGKRAAKAKDKTRVKPKARAKPKAKSAAKSAR